MLNPGDEVSRKIQQFLGPSIPSTITTKKPSSRPTPFNPRDDLLSTVGNYDSNESPSTNRSTLDVIDKCRMLTEKMNHMSNSVHSVRPICLNFFFPNQVLRLRFSRLLLPKKI